MKIQLIAPPVMLALMMGSASAANTSSSMDSSAYLQVNSSNSAETSIDPTSEMCPPGQRMATRIITGETGTTITEECVKPFSSTSS